MSDFDKEAEREKLREKYEQDEKEREATRRMSDLLLKGATMTNSHCGTCGDPLFQMDDTTFCPSCHGNPDAVEGTDLEAQPAEGGDGDREEVEGGDGDREGAEGGDGTSERTATADESRAARDDAGSAGRRDAEPTDRDPATSTTTSPRDARTSPSRGEPSPNVEGDRSGRDLSPPSGPSPSGDLETAHDSLVAALEKFARKAAETDDPRHARACLEAAREASETLNSLQ